MVKVVAKHDVKEDQVDKVLVIAEELVSATVKEDGCIKYEMFQDVKDKTILTMIEEWESQEALDKHMATEHFKRIVPLMGECLNKPGEINIYKRVL